MSKVYIALGSNLDEPSEQIYKAINSIDAIDDLSVTHISSLYKTKPIGKIDQPDFINAAIEVEGDISPGNLHTALQNIETQAGRIRKALNEPRTLDLDILLIDDLIMKTKKLTVPHPRMHQRQFVIVPLFEINPRLNIPGIGPINKILKLLPDQGVVKI
jgi:2-amino-4-hydroxy-6-hydroxymethyldihydropteridine diphosphokinase